MAIPRNIAERRQPRGGGNQDPDVAVAQYVLDLAWTQHRIDRNEDRARGRGAKERHDRLDPFFEIDRDPLAGIDAEKNLLLIQGAIPGPNGGYVVIKQTNKL